jgi:hypothetical protein
MMDKERSLASPKAPHLGGSDPPANRGDVPNEFLRRNALIERTALVSVSLDFSTRALSPAAKPTASATKLRGFRMGELRGPMTHSPQARTRLLGTIGVDRGVL